MTRIRLRKLCFFSYSLQRTSHDFENKKQQKYDAHRKESVNTQWVVSQPMHKKSQPAAIVTRREQQEAITYCGSDFENQIF